MFFEVIEGRYGDEFGLLGMGRWSSLPPSGGDIWPSGPTTMNSVLLVLSLSRFEDIQVFISFRQLTSERGGYHQDTAVYHQHKSGNWEHGGGLSDQGGVCIWWKGRVQAQSLEAHLVWLDITVGCHLIHLHKWTKFPQPDVCTTPSSDHLLVFLLMLPCVFPCGSVATSVHFLYLHVLLPVRSFTPLPVNLFANIKNTLHHSFFDFVFGSFCLFALLTHTPHIPNCCFVLCVSGP